MRSRLFFLAVAAVAASVFLIRSAIRRLSRLLIHGLCKFFKRCNANKGHTVGKSISDNRACGIADWKSEIRIAGSGYTLSRYCAQVQTFSGSRSRILTRVISAATRITLTITDSKIGNATSLRTVGSAGARQRNKLLIRRTITRSIRR